MSYARYTWVLQDTENKEGLGCAYIDDLKVNHIIIEAKKKVDFLFILSHDGIEYVDAPMPETIARYRDLIDYGADGVLAPIRIAPKDGRIIKGNLFFTA